MVSVVCIYARDSQVGRIADDFASEGADVHLWAVDEICPSVRRWTRGVGPGDKVENLNRLFPFFRAAERVLFTDDDIEFPSGFLKKFISIVDEFTLELAQPALSHQSEHSFPQTLARPDLLVRETNYVEQMVFTMGHTMVQRVMPTPSAFWMGWGMEMLWEKAIRENGWRSGIVDYTPVHHRMRPMFSRYNPKEATVRMQSAFNAYHLSSVPMRIICGFSERGRCDWLAPGAIRFISVLRRELVSSSGEWGEEAGTKDWIVNTLPSPLRIYWGLARLIYGRLRLAFTDDPEIKALFEGETRLEDRERFVIDLASILRERHDEDSGLRRFVAGFKSQLREFGQRDAWKVVS